MAGAVDAEAMGDTTGELEQDMVCTLSIHTRPHPMEVTHMLRMRGPEPNLSTVANERQMAKSHTNLKEAHLPKLMPQLNMTSRKHRKHIQTKTGLGCSVRLNT